MSKGHEGSERPGSPSLLELRFNLAVELAGPSDGENGDVNVDIALNIYATTDLSKKKSLTNLCVICVTKTRQSDAACDP